MQQMVIGINCRVYSVLMVPFTMPHALCMLRVKDDQATFLKRKVLVK